MQLSDIKKLAEMARIKMSDEELESMAHDFDSILAYVDQIKQVSGDGNQVETPTICNITREDLVTNESGAYTEKILREMPFTQDGYLKVKQIL
jgi:aspartyl-tRNA(Asn)/glutamyl-tRNA(Gln) amidotransferase subunit C